MKCLSSLILMAILVAVSTTVTAEIPQSISYQGRLIGDTGGPMPDGSYLIHFKIYDDSVAGAIRWSSSRQIEVLNGLFSYNLGDTIPLPHDLFATDTGLWIAMQVGTDPELAPRLRLTSHAYAFQALRADTAAIAATVNDNAISSAKIAPGAVTSSHILNGEIQKVDLAFNPLSQTDLDTHAADPSAHHTKTTSAGDLTSGYLLDARLSDNVPLKSTSNTFTNSNTFQSLISIGDSTFRANNDGVRIGRTYAPSSAVLLDVERSYNTVDSRYGIESIVDNVSTGNLYGMYCRARSMTPGSGGTVRGAYIAGRSDAEYRYGAQVRCEAMSSELSTGYSYGLYTTANDGAYAFGIYSVAYDAVTSYAGYFSGDVSISGTLSKAGGSFKIDHPLDPENKYLQHSFVESPDMMNIYNGNVITDANGEATVTLPRYFEALNRDFRYQLTVIGTFAQAIVGEEIRNGRFTILTDQPDVKVSWQVTGIRQDRWAEAHRIEVEPDKPAPERGYYLHYEEWNQSLERAVDRNHILKARKESEAPSDNQPE